MAKKETAVANVISEEDLALLKDSYPVEQGLTRMQLPRLGMAAQDVTEGKGKSMKVTTEAGTFFIENQTDEVGENGKKVWAKEEIGTEFEGIIVFKRYQLRYYDGVSYTSSPIYDDENQVIPLFKDKAEVDRGTPKELRSRKIYQGVSTKGKAISKLEENRILYVLYKDEFYQMTLRGTSMYAFMRYAKSVVPPAVVTCFNSESKENGSIAWNQMTFGMVRAISGDEASLVKEKMTQMKEAVDTEKRFYESKAPVSGTISEADAEMEQLTGK